MTSCVKNKTVILVALALRGYQINEVLITWRYGCKNLYGFGQITGITFLPCLR